jgi:hypothetical protein
MGNTSLQMFQDWSSRNDVHLNRHLSILKRQSDIFARYVDAIKSYPVSAPEFVAEIMNLHSSIVVLLDELRETNDSFVQDCDDFKNILDTLRSEVLKVYNEK